MNNSTAPLRITLELEYEHEVPSQQQSERMEYLLDQALKRWEEVSFISFAAAFTVEGKDIRSINGIQEGNEDSADVVKLITTFHKLLDVEPEKLPWHILRKKSQEEQRKEGLCKYMVFHLNDDEETYQFDSLENNIVVGGISRIRNLSPEQIQQDWEADDLSSLPLEERELKFYYWHLIAPVLLGERVAEARIKQSREPRTLKKSQVLFVILGTRQEFVSTEFQRDYGLILGLTTDALDPEQNMVNQNIIDSIVASWNILVVSNYIKEAAERRTSLMVTSALAHAVKTYIANKVQGKIQKQLYQFGKSLVKEFSENIFNRAQIVLNNNNNQALGEMISELETFRKNQTIESFIRKKGQNEYQKEIVETVNSVGVLSRLIIFITQLNRFKMINKPEEDKQGKEGDLSTYNLVDQLCEFFKSSLEPFKYRVKILQENLDKDSYNGKWINKLYLEMVLWDVVSNIKQYAPSSSDVSVTLKQILTDSLSDVLQIEVINLIEEDQQSDRQIEKELERKSNDDPIRREYPLLLTRKTNSANLLFDALGGESNFFCMYQSEDDSSKKYEYFVTQILYDISHWKKLLEKSERWKNSR